MEIGFLTLLCALLILLCRCFTMLGLSWHCTSSRDHALSSYCPWSGVACIEILSALLFCCRIGHCWSGMAPVAYLISLYMMSVIFMHRCLIFGVEGAFF